MKLASALSFTIQIPDDGVELMVPHLENTYEHRCFFSVE
jgi:hypothetical protein